LPHRASLGGLIAMPLLAAIFSLIGLLEPSSSAYVDGVDKARFWSQMQGSWNCVTLRMIVKSVVFGATLQPIAVMRATTPANCGGVGLATTPTGSHRRCSRFCSITC